MAHSDPNASRTTLPQTPLSRAGSVNLRSGKEGRATGITTRSGCDAENANGAAVPLNKPEEQKLRIRYVAVLSQQKQTQAMPQKCAVREL